MTDEPNNLPGPACLPLADPNPPRLTPTEPHLFQLRLFQLSDDPYDEPKTLGTIHGAPWSITPADEALAEGFAAPQFPYNRSRLVEQSFTIRLDDYAGIELAAMLLGLPENLIRRPRMKYRAARRHAGYTRTGQQRPQTWTH